ncbi:hypothetical protein H6G65_12295 [Microcystis elabens FACHB-917]|nr:hypothetical protein [Microcystis elabens FACHB-917]
MSELLMAGIFLRGCRLSIGRFTKHIAIVATLAASIWFLLSPQAWNNPAHFILQSIHFSLDGAQAWGGCMNFLHSCPRKGEDWSVLTYLKDWLFSTMPLLHITGLIMAAFFIIAHITNFILRYKSKSFLWNDSGQRQVPTSFLLAFALQASVIPAVMIVSNGFIYDGIRHVLFLLPPLTIFSYLGLSKAFYRCTGKLQRLALYFATIVMAYLLLIDLILLHPYQYTYFNQLAIARGINWENTDIDFYYASDAESLRSFMKTEEFHQFASEGGLDVKGAPPMEHAYIAEHFPRQRGHKYFFTNHSREPGVRVRKDCRPVGKSVYRQQFFGPLNIYGTPQVCLATRYHDWDPF